jgi:alpha,alpha-trehalase
LQSGGFNFHFIRGTYQLSNLLQELALAREYGRKTIVLTESRLTEHPITRIQRLIKYSFWDNLTRRIDAEGLENICMDPKNRTNDQRNRIYIPFRDDYALKYFNNVALERPHLNLDVVKLPDDITPLFVKSLNDHPGILSLGLRETIDEEGEKVVRGTPFVVPGGRFNEMYGWDSYFEALGLLNDGRIELAKGMVDNFCYELEHYGKILNANRSYYLTRSQPPFLTDMIITTYKYLVNKGTPLVKTWLVRGFRACVKELFSVWLTHPRLDKIGLSKYHPMGLGIPPETEASHFNAIIEPFALLLGLTIEEYMIKYQSGDIVESQLDEYFLHDRAVRESGHDTTYRFENRCANLATIDLNSLIYKYEMDLYSTIENLFGKALRVRIRKGVNDCNLLKFEDWFRLVKQLGVEAALLDPLWDCAWAKGIIIYDLGSDRWERNDQVFEDELKYENINTNLDFMVYFPSSLFLKLATKTKELVNQYLWCPKRNLFFDWDCKMNQRSDYETVTCLYALWAGVATHEQASLLVPNISTTFEHDGGLVSGTEVSRGEIRLDRPNRQWVI